MKKPNILSCLTLLSFLLVGCTTTSLTSTSQDQTTSDFDSISEITSENIESSQTTSSENTRHDPVELDFYCINDLHGRIQGDKSDETSIAKLATFMNNKKAENPDNYVFLNAGDMFQDTYDSGTNHGELLAKTMPLMETEAMAIGNHEFDWGTSYLMKNREFAQTSAFLGANIYHYDNKNNKVLDFASELADEYKIIERSGTRIGLIGIIGRDQITSITSTLVEGYTFLEPSQIVMDLSDHLKTEENCDAVVVMSHASYENLNDQAPFSSKVTSVSKVSGERYVDAVFTAHTHQEEIDFANGVSFIQAGCHGNSVSHLTLRIEKDEPVKTLTTEILPVPYARLTPDPKVQSLVDSYLTEEFYQEKNSPVATIKSGDNGYAYSLPRHEGGNLSAWATYDLLTRQDGCPNIDIVLNNSARSTVYLHENGQISKGLIFDSIPFTNKTYVASIKGIDIKNQLKWRNSNYAPNPITLDNDTYYNVATTDYMLFHKDADGNYDRFPSFTGEYLFKEDRYPVELTYTFLKEKQTIDFNVLKYGQEFKNIKEA